MSTPAEIALRLKEVRDRVAGAASKAGRSASAVRLVAVSKTFPIEDVRAAAAAGQVDFGENKVQEGAAKILAAGPLKLTWHFIGHLQSNKARKAAASFDVIHSVDSIDLLQALDEAARARSRPIDVLIQVDLAHEPTKHGATEPELAAILECAQGCSMARLKGLMLLPPAVTDPDAARPYFAALLALRDRFIQGGVPAAMLTELSMGMSHDFEVAIEEGATLVRVGSAIFGERSHH